jgi:hypothetical protein
MIDSLEATRTLATAKWAFTTRRVPRALVNQMHRSWATARAGDLVLAEVVELGQHTGLQLAQGRRAELYIGDRIVACLGNRYAPDQFEALARVGDDTLDLVAAGGVVGSVVEAHSRMDAPTRLRPLGLLCDASRQTLNVARFGLVPERATRRPPVIAVLGTSMNAGKTTAVAAVVQGLARAGLRVGAAKVTGTGAFADLQAFADAGAAEVVDFTDFGHATTYLAGIEAVHRVLESSLDHLDGCDAIVIEVADGLFQRETAALLRSHEFRGAVDGVVFAAPDALSAVHGAGLVLGAGLPLVAVGGLLTMSPLATREARRELTVPLYTRAELCDPATGRSLLAHLRPRAQALMEAAA